MEHRYTIKEKSLFIFLITMVSLNAFADIIYTFHLDGVDAGIRSQIEASVTEAVSLYNYHSSFNKELNIYYDSNPGTTANGNYNGTINFGTQRTTRTALHEILHTLGVGQLSAWPALMTSNTWDGTYGNAQLSEFDGVGSILNGDTQHFWPYGLNQEGEYNIQSRFRSIRMMASLAADMGAYVSFVQEPISEIVPSGSIAEFSVIMPGSSSFAWYKQGNPSPLTNGGDISGATSSILQIANVESADEGRYYCISNGLRSRPAYLMILKSASQLVGHWEFDGDYTDNVGPTNATVTGYPFYGQGYTGQAIDLAGIDEYVTLPAGIVNYTDITLAAWVYWDGGGQWQRIFDFGNGTNEYMFLTPRSGSNTLRFAIKNGGTEQQVETSQLASGQWSHLALTLGGSTAKLYVNGAPAATNTSVTINPSDFNPINNYIGDSQFVSDPLFDGLIDDFRLYNYALSASEIEAISSQVYYPGSNITIVGAAAGAEEAGNPAADSFDDDVTNRWCNDNILGNAWIQYDLGDEYNIGQIQLLLYKGTIRTYPIRIEIDGIEVFSGNTSLSSGFWSAAFPPLSGRYITITMTGTNSDGSHWFSINEAQAWGPSNTPPTFISDPINNLGAIELTDYTGNSLAAYADDAEGIETLTFSIDDGPSWLTILSDGTLYGIPTNADVGNNTFTVRVIDNGGEYDTATMTIDVANVYSGTQGLPDLAGLAAQWLATDCGLCDGADLSGDTHVDIVDLDLLAYRWLADETLRLHLPFEEGVGAATADHSIFAESAVLVNGPTWTTGHAGGALSFDGADDYVEVPGYKGISGGHSRTCMAWIKTTTVSGEIMAWGTPSAGKKWIIRVNETGTLRSEVEGGFIYGTAVVNDGAWHHIAVVLNNDGTPDVSELLLYVDGQLEATTTAVEKPIDTAAEENVMVGVFGGHPVRYFNGLIDDVRIYSTALTEQQIQEIANP